MKINLDRLVDGAMAGSRDDLEAVIGEIQDMVHHLAMRILVDPDNAQEATQEILITVVTKLSTFEGKSAFRTWVYRIAVNYLLNAKRVLDREAGLTFEMFEEDLHAGLVPDPVLNGEETVALSELRISCTMAMLLCLDLNHRVAYVLGDVLEFDHEEGADILRISKSNFRKRLSRARNQVVTFTSKNCGLVNEASKCSCPRRLPAAIASGRVSTEHPRYAQEGTPPYSEIVDQARSVEGALRTLTLQRATPQFSCPEKLGARLVEIVSGNC